jgi:hypothetical protein
VIRTIEDQTTTIEPTCQDTVGQPMEGLGEVEVSEVPIENLIGPNDKAAEIQKGSASPSFCVDDDTPEAEEPTLLPLGGK